MAFEALGQDLLRQRAQIVGLSIRVQARSGGWRGEFTLHTLIDPIVEQLARPPGAAAHEQPARQRIADLLRSF
jgi:hypothetical protein